jgi:hypothetical protein
MRAPEPSVLSLYLPVPVDPDAVLARARGIHLSGGLASGITAAGWAWAWRRFPAG